MACKHEGGTDPCVRYENGVCRVYARAYYRANLDHIWAQRKTYFDTHPDQSSAARAKQWRKANRCEHGTTRSQCGICQPHKTVWKYKHSAASRGHVWELSDAQAVWLMQQPCAYCAQEKAGGIDRAKNEYGYTVLNSVPCCKTCNFSKTTSTVKAFIVAVNQIARYCPDYPVFKRRWERIRKGLEKLAQQDTVQTVG